MTQDLRDRAKAWAAVDPDPETAAELRALIDRDDDEATEELAARFSGRLQFGTAGLRGELGAGPMRMNRVIVRRAAWGLVRHLLEEDPTSAERGIVIGCDARINSAAFAEDTARVAAALGMRALVLPERVPTPVLAFSITELGTAAGVMVTASHNPPKDNGYKVYLGTGAQIVPPHDVEISAWIDRAPDEVPVCELDDPRIVRLGGELVDRYIDAVPVAARFDVPVTVAYTPVHGVGGRVLLRAFEHAGLPEPTVVDSQFEPDPSFSTVTFPNPEEPGTMDLVIDLAQRIDADVAIANDPDADRLGVAIPTGDGSWRLLAGDEIGWLLADHRLRATAALGADRLVVTTYVSSSLLGEMAAAAGVQYAETSTGFKWIARAAVADPALVRVRVRAGARLPGRTAPRQGRHHRRGRVRRTRRRSQAGWSHRANLLDDLAAVRAPRDQGDRCGCRRPRGGGRRSACAAPPTALAGRAVTEVTWIADAGLLRCQLEGGVRVQVRPSGTEPKVKIYGEAVGETPAPFVDAMAGSSPADQAEAVRPAGCGAKVECLVGRSRPR
ncbi:MAG: phospho-sugar mutase [Ilumatobacteraceae bacterium]